MFKLVFKITFFLNVSYNSLLNFDKLVIVSTFKYYKLDKS